MINNLLKNADIATMLGQLFGDLEGVHFFLKDKNSRIFYVSENMFEHMGLSQRDIQGKYDKDIFSAELAEKYLQDDRDVMNSGKPLTGIIELFLNEQGIPSWHNTNKYPVFDRHKNVIGVMGTITKIDSDFAKCQGQHSLLPAIDYIEKHYHQKISVDSLANACSMSMRSLQRAFHKHFMTTPRKFIIKRRCYEACLLLKNCNLSLSDVAQRAGFYDQSDLARQFRAVMNLSPTEYRKRYS